MATNLTPGYKGPKQQPMTAQERLDHMKLAIAEGGSAMQEGRVIMSVAELPSLAELASTPEEREQASLSIAERRALLDDEEALLSTQAAAAGKSTDAGAAAKGGAAGDGKDKDKAK